ncbi:type II toxin-antitoxin system RelE/ParE family toxin [Arcticibacter eurypsychrophilus]|uniref:type II toxin-antitoxin system RelE/ParE family toxin n=1 Tax=Arcticibacter eurypsychrophilus TaxID=1434752 RepID=UPI00084D93F6|nr:type II toxin-antitoxin system RelE/ParE family toxin [Arcticibacter eurypsychrophilus]
MEITFKEQSLADLYEGKKVRDKRFQFQPQVIKQYIKTLNKLRSLDNIEQAFQYNTLRYEKLSGNLKGKSSVSVNMQYRIIFQEIASEKAPFEIILIDIEALNNHYS